MADKFIKYVLNIKFVTSIAFLLLIIFGSIHIISWLSEPGIPVFMYHAFSDEPREGDAELYVSTDEFEKHLIYFKNSGYTTVFAEDFNNVSGFDRPIIITMDDGYEDNYTEVFPILKKHNMKATIFVISSYIGKSDYLKAEQLREMSDSSLVSIQSHSLSHIRLTDCSEAELKKEFKQSIDCIEAITGKSVSTLAYPGGFYDKNVIECAKKYFKLAYCVSSKNLNYEDNFEIDRVGIFRSTDLYSLECSLWYKTRTRFERITTP